MVLARRLDDLADRAADRLEAAFPRGDSAILLLLVHDTSGDGGGEPGLVLTRRSADLRTDPGYVAFPGGRIDEGESIWDTAGRECEEEVGVPRADVTFHGRLDDTWNGAGFRIVPVVASTPGPVTLRPREAEVSAAAVVPLAAVVNDDHHQVVTKRLDGHDFLDDVIEFAHRDLRWQLYGPTADIARDLTAWLRGDDRRSHARRQADLDHFAAVRDW